ncbi:MAG: bacterial Ig-like domain-containing protein [Treponema sp.]|jgi:hypothetical protein|nr:bacterial Ig-like domain-containing protein [Treponema sp.]
MKKAGRRFFPVICALCLTGLLAGASCSNPIYNTPGAFDPDEATAITVTPPTKRLYYWGENLDMADASANIHYRGPGVDSKLNQKIKDSQVSGFDSRKGGIQTIAVTLEGRSDYFDIALLPFSPADDDKTIPMSLSPNEEKIIQNSLGGAWKVYIFESASRAVVRPSGNGKDGTYGSKGDVVFNAPAVASGYIMAISFTNGDTSYPLFYRLTVQ